MDGMVEKEAPKDMRFRPKDGDYFMRFSSFRGGATDFAQKYLFKSTPSDQDNLEILSQFSEESGHDASSDGEDSYPNETSQGTLDQDELVQQLTSSSHDHAVEKQKDMIFSCCDWERGREQPDLDVDQISHSAGKCSKRKEKALRKEQEPVFDIDSIMNPRSTEEAVDAKRYFSQVEATKRGALNVVTGCLKIQKSHDTSPAFVSSVSHTFCKPLTLIDTPSKKDECLSPMGHTEARFDFNVK